MTDLLEQVTPLTKGIIWITNGEISSQAKFYKQIDYLLNGLLTATLNSSTASSHVLLGNNFGSNFYVLAGTVDEKNLTNYFELLKLQLSDESRVLLIDEADVYKSLNKKLSHEIQNKIQVIL